ncbi:MAG: hypothetical protein ACE5MM_01025 [Nitrospiraceae bacterium]
MRFSPARLNVVYERPFKQPVFRVSKSAVEILGCIYETLNPKYPMVMSDLTATAAQSMGDIAIRARLFGGNGLLELGVEKFTARFEGLQSKEDVEIIKDVIILSEDALQRALPGTQYKGATVGTSAWLICEDGEKGAQNILKKYGVHDASISPKKFGAEKIKIPISGELQNEKEGWSINFLIETSKLAGAHIYVLCNGAYVENSRFNTFEERAEHYDAIYRDLLANYGLEPVADEKDT